MELPKKTPAAILFEQQKNLEVNLIRLPNKLYAGQIMVEFFYSGICGSQIGEIDGVKGLDNWLPHLLGHEGTGKVIGIGPGVTRFEIGDKVIAHWKPSSGIDAEPPKYSLDNVTINAGKVTTFNKYAVISENRLTKMPVGYNEIEATLFGCAVTTAFGTIDNVAEVKLGDKVVIYGAGGVGLNLVQATYMAGASEIIAVDLFENRLSLARSFGATSTLTGNPKVIKEKIKVLTNNNLDIFIDNTGNTDIISMGYSIIRKTGKLVLVGVPSCSKNISIHSLDLHFGKSIKGSHGGEAKPHLDIPRYMNLLKKRKQKLSIIISQVAPLANVNELIHSMKSGESAGRCIVDLKSS